MMTLVAVTGIGYAALILFMIGATRINPPEAE